jgi:hypothetical protein
VLTLHRAAAAVGGLRWCELAVWRALSAWAHDADVTDPAAAVLWDSHAAHAAWRAGQWWDRLPVLAGVERAALVRPPSPGWESLGAALCEPATTVVRLAGAYRVALPHLAAAYARLGPSTSPVADGPLRRTLAQAESDVAADWHAGTFLLLERLTGPARVTEAAAATSVLERLALGHPAGEASQ